MVNNYEGYKKDAAEFEIIEEGGVSMLVQVPEEEGSVLVMVEDVNISSLTAEGFPISLKHEFEIKFDPPEISLDRDALGSPLFLLGTLHEIGHGHTWSKLEKDNENKLIKGLFNRTFEEAKDDLISLDHNIRSREFRAWKYAILQYLELCEQIPKMKDFLPPEDVWNHVQGKYHMYRTAAASARAINPDEAPVILSETQEVWETSTRALRDLLQE